MAGISTFGGAAAGGGSSGSSGLEIGQGYQGMPAKNSVPMDGSVLAKTDYPDLYAYNAATGAVPTPLNTGLGSTLPLSGSVWQVAYNPASGVFAAGSATSSQTSVVSYDNGASWVTVTWAFPVTFTALVCDGSKFIMQSGTGIYNSVDGVTWTQVGTNPTNLAGTLSIVGTNTLAKHEPGTSTTAGVPTRGYATSTDGGATWVIKGIPLGTVSKVIKATNTYVAIGTTGAFASTTNVIATSADGITWVNRTLPQLDTMMSVTANGSTIVIVGKAFVFTSTDGITWTATANTYGTVNAVTSFTATSTAFILAGTFGTTVSVYTSTDGVTWTLITATSSVLSRAMTYAGSMYVMPVNASNVVLTSTDLVTWNVVNLPVFADWSLCVWTGSLMVLLSNGATSLSSTDGVTWTTASTSVPVAVGARSHWAIAGTSIVVTNTTSTTNVIQSNDGITWTTRTLPAAAVWTNIASNGSLFVAVAGVASGASSPDGITWTARTVSSIGDVVSNGTIFVGSLLNSTANAAVYSSPDGITWTARSTGYTGAFGTMQGTMWTGTVFAAVYFASGSYFYSTSPDGITWTYKGQFTNFAGYTPLVSSVFQANGAHKMFFTGLNGSSYVGSTDSTGTTWSLTQSPLPAVTASPVLYGASSDTVIGVSGPILFKYTNASGVFTASALPSTGGYHLSAHATPLWTGSNWVIASKTTGNTVAPFYLTTANLTSFTKNVSPSLATSDPLYVNGKLVFNTATGFYTSPSNGTWKFTAHPVTVLTNIGFGGMSPQGGSASVGLWIYNYTTQAYYFQLPMFTTDGVNIAAMGPQGIGSSTGMQYSIASSNTVSVATSSFTNGVSVSTDAGITWSFKPVPILAGAVAYNATLGVFAAIPHSITTAASVAITSTDGINWVQRTLPSAASWQGVVSFGKTFVAFANSPTAYNTAGGSAVWAISPNGATWTALAAPSTTNWSKAAVSPTGLVAVAGYPSVVSTVSGYAVKAFDDANYFQVPYVAPVVGSPQWYVKAK